LHFAAGFRQLTAMPTFVVWGESLRKRGQRWEPKWLGDIDAKSLDDAHRIAAERWPGIRFNISQQTNAPPPSTPKSGCDGGR
jgi:hypothetical protein